MTRSLRLETVAPADLELAPGGSATCAVTVRNTSDLVEHVELSAVGLPGGSSVRCEPPVLKLMPGTSCPATLTLSVPHAPAGPYVVGLLARSTHRRDVSVCEEVRLRVLPAPALAATLTPELVRTRTSGALALVLDNRGNTLLHVEVRGSEPERCVSVEISPSRASLAAGERVVCRVQTRAPQALSGPPASRRLTLTASDLGGTATAEVVATLVQQPWLPPPVVRVAAVVAGLALAGAAAVVVHDIRPPGSPGPVRPVAATSVPVVSSPPSAAPSPTAAPTPAPTPSPTPTASAAPSPTAPASASASPSTTPTPTPSPTATSTGGDVAFGTVLPPVTTDSLLTDDDLGRLRARGLVLSGLPTGDDADCAAARSVAAHHDPATGTSVSAAAADDPTLCTATPLQVAFPAGAQGVELTVAVSSDAYRVRVDRHGATGGPELLDFSVSVVSAAQGVLQIPASTAGSIDGVVVTDEGTGALGLLRVQYTAARS